MVARARFEPTTLRLKGIDSTNVLPRPTCSKQSPVEKKTIQQRFYQSHLGLRVLLPAEIDYLVL